MSPDEQVKSSETRLRCWKLPCNFKFFPKSQSKCSPCEALLCRSNLWYNLCKLAAAHTVWVNCSLTKTFTCCTLSIMRTCIERHLTVSIGQYEPSSITRPFLGSLSCNIQTTRLMREFVGLLAWLCHHLSEFSDRVSPTLQKRGERTRGPRYMVFF